MGETTSSGRRWSRTRRIVGGTALVLAVLSATYIFLGRSSLLDVEQVEIYGIHRITAVEIEEKLGFRRGDPLLSVDSQEIQRNLELLPWVLAADVERRWNGLIRVDIVERRAIAIAMVAPQRWALIDISGRVLTEALPFPPDLVRLSGVHAAGTPGSYMSTDSTALLAVLGALPTELGQRFYSLRRDGNEIVGDLKSDQEVVFGDDGRLSAKVIALAATLTHLEDQNRNDRYIDVSTPRDVLVRKDPERGNAP
ncbi:MAG TPA: FtsQ-type POTRA domain-containing protein [Acidimicrobiales bacterium]|nr:FtsQ-type POTRA domain-containing protein [Acidimicrobiales bacterium]